MALTRRELFKGASTLAAAAVVSRAAPIAAIAHPSCMIMGHGGPPRLGVAGDYYVCSVTALVYLRSDDAWHLLKEEDSSDE